MQAAMDDAVSRPLTMTFEPLDELFAHGWDLVDYEPEMRVAPKKKSSKQGTTLKKEQTPFKVDVSNPPAPLAPEESVVSDDIAPSNLAMASIDSHLKSPMGAAAAKAGALMKNLVSSVGCALGYGGNGRKCEAVYGSTLQADLSAPPTPAAR